MITRIKVAVEARADGDILIIARTDARRSEGLNAALHRLQHYSAAGADIVFFEAAETADEIRQASDALDKPLLINAAHGGKTPILNPDQYAALGAKIVIYPAGAPLSASQAAASFYRNLKSGDANSAHNGLFDFSEMSRLLGLDDIIALQTRHPLS
jgi:2,3-dimethylmalate lyase